jgi:hypothetical protein
VFVCNVCYLSVVLLYYCHRLKPNCSSTNIYCDVFCRKPSLLGNLKLDTPVVARQPKVKHFHGYAHPSVLSRSMVA